MNSPTPKTDSSRRIFIGLAIGLLIGIALNAAPYFLFAMPSEEDAAKFNMPQLHKIGFPLTCWAENRAGEPTFYWGALLIDVCATLGIAIALAQWLEKRGKSDSATSEQPSPSETTE